MRRCGRSASSKDVTAVTAATSSHGSNNRRRDATGTVMRGIVSEDALAYVVSGPQNKGVKGNKSKYYVRKYEKKFSLVIR